ncbi:MAG TPA: hypothetical protein VFY23_16535 [Candidatus Limnocylindrales bacterium]|nr:hypothetical protein [Candidatus Limnocylindrales bacterium]
MSRPTIVRLFLGSIVAVVAGIVLGLLAVLAAYQGGAFVMDGPDVAGLQPTPLAAGTAIVFLVSLLALLAGGIAGLAAWIGALLNTAQLDDRTWFLVLLVLGIWNLGVVAMLVYVIAGPDGTLAAREREQALGVAR